MAKLPWRQLSPPGFIAPSLRSYTGALRTGAWLRGPHVAQFEERLAKLADLPVENVIATVTCTDALAAAAWAILGKSSARVCPFTYAGTYTGIVGPLEWVDCDEEGWPVEDVTVGVELWGRRLEHSRCEIMDAAHRFSPEEHGVLLSGGDVLAVCYSFGPMKEVPGVRGGALLCASGEHAQLARRFVNNGITPGGKLPDYPFGRKSYMANAEAGFLGPQFREAARWRGARQRVLDAYSRYFPKGSNVAELMTLPGEASGHLAVLRFPSRGAREIARDALSVLSVETSVHYPVPENAPQGCKDLSGRVLSVPCHVSLTEVGVSLVAKRIISA